MKNQLKGRVIDLIILLFKALSRRQRKRVAFSLATLILKLAKKTRLRAIANISNAMPHLSHEEVEHLAFTSYQNIVFGVLECFWLDQVTFDFHISSSAQKILDSGAGVSVATMHMGCYEAVPFALQALTQRSSTLSKIPKFLTCAQQVYQRMGVQCIDKHETGGIFHLLKAINNQRVVSLHSDHYASDTELTFFGRKTGAPCGAAILSAYGRVPLLLSFAILQPDGRYKVYIETVNSTCVQHDQASYHLAMKQVYQRFEEIILQYPEHWYWSYKRWR